MRPQKEDLVDRCKLEARQRVETKHTNRSIAFLCLALSLAIGARRRSQLKSISIKWPSIERFDERFVWRPYRQGNTCSHSEHRSQAW